ncbi:MAG TPA: hypothetical protein VGI24_10550 [Solirubrobacteraceae bacterium]
MGLIAEELDQSHFSVCLIGSPGTGREPREYGLAFTDPDIGLEYRIVDEYSDAATVSELPSRILSEIGSTAPLLITCALAAQITTRMEFLADVIDRRLAGSETVLVACENEPHDAYRELARRCAGKFVTCPCIVDRICAWPSTVTIDENGETIVIEHRRDDENRRVVLVHPVGEWVIAAPQPIPATLMQLQRAPLVQITHGEITGYENRKLWSVNGVHMVLALVARLEGIRQLPLIEPYQQAFLQTAMPLMAQITAAIEDQYPDIPHDPDYMPDRIRAFAQAPDTTARILEQTLKRSDLRAFMGRLNRRIGNAARAAHKAGQSCEPFYEAMTLVVDVLSSRPLYYRETEPKPIDDLIDQEVLVMFAATLADWLDGPRAQDLQATLGRALNAHRSL